jgi:hypothetical protein
MQNLKCNVTTCKYNQSSQCCAENVMVNAIRPGCTSKEGTYCEAYEKSDLNEKCRSTDGQSCWN